jgi:hypothetical protein
MSEENEPTPIEVRCDILSELWIDYRHQEDFKDFIDYNDLGLPMAFMLAESLVSATPQAHTIINETFDLFLASLGIKEDGGYDNLDDILVG